MTFGNDNNDIEQECIVCEAPTNSHPAPNGYFCHTCVTEREDTELLEALSVGPFPDLNTETSVSCEWCGTTHTVNGAVTLGTDGIRVGVGYPVFDTYTGMVFISCPSCAKATEYLTTAEQAETLASRLEIDIMKYDRRKGWTQ